MIRKISHDDVYPIRHQVMWPYKPLDYIKIQGDESADHYGFYVDEILVSVISVFDTETGYQFRKFATLEDYQGRGYGSLLLDYIMSNYEGVIWCNARLEKCGFYEKFGLTKTKDRFTKGGKEYVIMKKS